MYCTFLHQVAFVNFMHHYDSHLISVICHTALNSQIYNNIKFSKCNITNSLCCCHVAPDSFSTGMDWLLDRTVESCSIGVAFGQSSFTDLDFADDVSLFAVTARASCSHIGDNCK